MLEDGFLCSVREVAECGFYKFLCSELKSRRVASELLMTSIHLLSKQALRKDMRGKGDETWIGCTVG